MPATKPWAKLDFDWFEDTDVIELRSRLGVRGELAWARLVAIWADFKDARIDLGAPGVRRLLEMKLERKGGALDALFGEMADIGLIDADLYASLGVVTCSRAADDARNRQRCREGGAAGGKKSGSTRKARATPETKQASKHA